MKGTFKLGKAGIDLFIHWTFRYLLYLLFISIIGQGITLFKFWSVVFVLCILSQL
jgi:hypothetical protein